MFKKLLNWFLENDYCHEEHDNHWLMLRDKYNYPNKY